MIRVAFLSIFAIHLFSVLCSAQEIEINVHTRSEPKAALGIFFTSGKVVQQPNTSFERINENTVVVRMPYNVSSLPSASPFATAYLLTADNEIIFGDVRLVSAADSSDSFWRISTCSPDESRTTTDMLVPEQFNYLNSLLEVRIKKREVARKLLAEKMNPDLVSRLQKWEKRFGIEHDNPLSPELPGLELVERLTKLKDTILLFRNTKEGNKPTAVPE